MNFEPNDTIAVFKVLERRPNEILLGWSFTKGESNTGRTYFSIEGDMLRFGTGIIDFNTVDKSFSGTIHRGYTKLLIGAALWTI